MDKNLEDIKLHHKDILSAILKITKEVVSVNTIGKMVKYMKENGTMVSVMVTVYGNLQKEILISVNG
jgi:hypothetical protein